MIEFENPGLLHLLWGVLLQGVLLWFYWRWRHNTLRHLGSRALEERLLQGFSAKRFWLKNALFAGVMVCVVLAIANPRKAMRVQPGPVNSSDVLIALDVSNSMLANDIRPSRLEKAKQFIEKLIKALEGERIGLIFFAGASQPQAPLSTDYGAVMMFARNATPAFIADQGTNLATAIEQATRMFESKTPAGKALLIISDGEHHEGNAVEAAQKARQEGIQIFTVAVGTAAGSTLADQNGSPIRTRVNEPFLRELALAGGGMALQIEDEAGVSTLDAAIAALPKAVTESQSYTTYYTYYPWLLLIAVLLLTLEQILWWKRRSDVSKLST